MSIFVKRLSDKQSYKLYGTRMERADGTLYALPTVITWFLIFQPGVGWIWKDANEFEPVEPFVPQSEPIKGESTTDRDEREGHL